MEKDGYEVIQHAAGTSKERQSAISAHVGDIQKVFRAATKAAEEVRAKERDAIDGAAAVENGLPKLGPQGAQLSAAVASMNRQVDAAQAEDRADEQARARAALSVNASLAAEARDLRAKLS